MTGVAALRRPFRFAAGAAPGTAIFSPARLSSFWNANSASG